MVGPSPLYDRVADRIREQISNGAIAPNSRIPSERILAETFGVSRVTVRQALKELESAGLVEVVAGARWARSSIVDPDYTTSEDSIEEGAAGLVSFSHLAQSNGLKATAEVLTNETRASTLDEADLLGIAPGAPIVDLVRLRYLDSIPTLIDFSLLPEGLAPGIGISVATFLGYSGALFAPTFLGFVAEHTGFAAIYGGLAALFVVVLALSGLARHAAAG